MPIEQSLTAGTGGASGAAPTGLSPAAKLSYASMAAAALGSLLDASEVDSSDIEIGADAALDGAAIGLQVAAFVPHPAAIAVGIFAAGLSYLSSKKKREEAERQWRQQVDRYKNQLKAKGRQVEQTSQQIEETARGGDLQSIFQATQEAVDNIYNSGIDSLATNITNITQKERIEALEEEGEALFENTYDKLLAQVDKLDEAQRLLQMEIAGAGRGGYGTLQGGYLERFEDKLAEVQYA